MKNSIQEVHFEVKDTGPGIPSEKLDRLFKPFSQVDSSASRRFEGTGLGLAISKRMAELMGGKIWVKSIEGEGSSFHFTLLAKSATGQDRNFLRQTDAILSSKSLLVIDKSEAMQNLLSRQISLWGMQIQSASTASKGLERLWASGDFDLVLIDPLGLSSAGKKWISDLQKICSSKEIPIVILSARTTDNGTLQDELGAIAALSKPVHPELLLETFRSVLVPATKATRTGDQVVRLPRKEKPAVPLRILLAEDNLINRRVAKLLLKSIGYEAHAVENGLEALEALRAATYDVVLMDVQMPVMDGFEASRNIWREFSKENRPYIIAMTAHSMAGDRERCLAAGMDAYVSKPADIGELKSALAKVPVINMKSALSK